jgi:hypothetical protein
MRTTVTIDPDVEKLLRRAMRESGVSFKQVLNNAVRDGLLGRDRIAQRTEKPFRQPTFDMGLPLVDLTKTNALIDELEDQAIIAKMRRGR